MMKTEPKAQPAPLDRIPSLKERYTKKQVEQAIVKCNGRWAALTAELDCTYNQVRVWMECHKDHAQLADRLRLAVVAQAEDEIARLLHSPNEATRKDVAKFILTTLGKDRGWGRETLAQQISVGDGQVEIRQIFGI